MRKETRQRANPGKNEADVVAGNDNNLPVPSNAQLEGTREKADIVKRQITIDLHQRKLSQKEIAEKMGITRQTVASVLASDSYFTEKHAVLFSLALGYDKEFLMTGKGALISGESDRGKERRLQVQNIEIDILSKLAKVFNTVCRIVLREGVESCTELLKKAMSLYNLYKTIQDSFPKNINGRENHPINPVLMESTLKLFTPGYDELVYLIEDKYGIQIEETC